jgi:hypothetical protein
LGHCCYGGIAAAVGLAAAEEKKNLVKRTLRGSFFVKASCISGFYMLYLKQE